MPTTPKREERMKENMFEANNELTHTTNQNCASPSSEEEEQKPTPVVRPRVERCVLGRAHAWEGGRTCRCRCLTLKLQYGIE